MSGIDRLSYLQNAERDRLRSKDQRGSLRKGVASGVEHVEALAYGAAGAVSGAVGFDRGEDWGLEGYERNMEQAARNQGDVTQLEQIESVGDAGSWLAFNFGSQLPVMTGIAGAGVGGAVAGNAARKAAKNVVERQIAREVKKLTTAGVGAAEAARVAAKKIGQEWIKRGAQAGALAGGAGLETGSIFGDVYEETGEKRPGVALGFGAIAGALEAAPFMRILGRVGINSNQATQSIIDKAVAVAKGATKYGTGEAITEGLQTAVELAAVDYVQDNLGSFELSDLSEIANAMAAGLFTGGAMGIPGTMAETAKFGKDAQYRTQLETIAGKLNTGEPTINVDQILQDVDRAQATRENEIDEEYVAKYQESGDSDVIFKAREEKAAIRAQADEVKKQAEATKQELAKHNADGEASGSGKDGGGQSRASERSTSDDGVSRSGAGGKPSTGSGSVSERDSAGTATGDSGRSDSSDAGKVEPVQGAGAGPDNTGSEQASSGDTRPNTDNNSLKADPFQNLPDEEEGLNRHRRYLLEQRMFGNGNQALQQRQLKEVNRRLRVLETQPGDLMAKEAPYKNEAGAKRRITRDKLTDSHEPVELSGGGWVVRPTGESNAKDEGNRAVSKDPAQRGREQKELDSGDGRQEAGESEGPQRGAGDSVEQRVSDGSKHEGKGNSGSGEREATGEIDGGKDNRKAPAKKSATKKKAKGKKKPTGKKTGGRVDAKSKRGITDRDGDTDATDSPPGGKSVSETPQPDDVAASGLDTVSEDGGTVGGNVAELPEGKGAELGSDKQHTDASPSQRDAAEKLPKPDRKRSRSGGVSKGRKNNDARARTDQSSNSEDQGTPGNRTGKGDSDSESRQGARRDSSGVSVVDESGESGTGQENSDAAVSDKAGFGKSNKVFTKTGFDDAIAKLKKKSSQLNSGFDPETAQLGMQVVGYYVEGGIRAFPDVVKRVVDDLGEEWRAFVPSWYAAVRTYPGIDTQGMSSEQEVANYAKAQLQAGKQENDESSETGGTETPGAADSVDESAVRPIDQAGATSSSSEIETEVAKVNTNPSEAQIEAENYRKGHIKWRGYDISIENPKGSKRSGVSSDGTKWENTMGAHYGDLKGTVGADGDALDIFLGPDPEGEFNFVYVIDQVLDGKFDEHKIMLGFNSADDAEKAYMDSYDTDWKGLGSLSPTGQNNFLDWVQSRDVHKDPFDGILARTLQNQADEASGKNQQEADAKLAASLNREKIKEYEKATGKKVKLDDLTYNTLPKEVEAWGKDQSAQRAENIFQNTFGVDSKTAEGVAADKKAADQKKKKRAKFSVVGHDTEAYKNDLFGAIADSFDDITDNRAMKRLIAKSQGIKLGEVTLPMMKEAQEMYERTLAVRTRLTVRDMQLEDGTTDADIYKTLVESYKKQPNLNVRSGDSMKRQAYSTPPPLAFVTSMLTGYVPRYDQSKKIAEQDRTANDTWDNSAGHGMLLIRHAEHDALVNELDPYRFATLKEAGFMIDDKPRNALDIPIDRLMDQEKLDSEGLIIPTAYIGNPPFGKMEGEYTTVSGDVMSTIDHALVAQGLDSIVDEGNGAFIIGANRKIGDTSSADKRFFKWLYGNYRVVDHVEIDGKLYTKQGASWPLRLITVRGREVSDKIGPKIDKITRIGDWERLYEHTQRVLDTVAKDNGESRSDRVSQRASPPGAKPSRITRIQDAANAKAGITSTDPATSGTGIKSGTDGSGSGQALDTPPQRSGDGAAADGTSGLAGSGVTSGSKKTGDSGTGRGSDTVSRQQSKSDDDSGSDQLGSDELQTEYKSASGLSSMGALVPSNMREPLQEFYETLKSKVGDIDSYVMDRLDYKSIDDLKSAFMGLQVDAVAAAIYNHENGERGIIIADQTGIGKGRQAAAMIRYARKNGKTPVFVTVKPNLYTDMYDDLADIGMTDAAPFIMNSSVGITKDDGSGNKTTLFKSGGPTVQKAAYADIISSGQLPDGANMMFMTYSQVTTDNVQRKVLDKIAPNAFLILDESHEMAGTQFNIKKGNIKVLTAGGFIRLMTDKAPTTYLSATYAKRPDNMTAFTRTSLADAIPKPDDKKKEQKGGRFGGTDNEFASAISAGGAPLQTVIANELTRKGQLIRRERSFEGISIAAEFDTENAVLHRRIADQLVVGLRAINVADKAFHALEVKNLKDEVKSSTVDVQGAGNRAGSGVDHSAFSAVLHNYISQMLLGLKADYAANAAIELHKQGIKPVLALDNTMESFISSNADGVAAGEVFDLDFRDVLMRALDRTRRISIRENGNARAVDVPLEELSPGTQILYNQAETAIRALELGGIPLSPIDYMKNKMQKAGINVGEITGRGVTLDYSGDKPVLSQRSAKEVKDRRGTVDDFNSGKLDGLVLNIAGSTGLSIHNSTKLAPEQQKKRHMIVVQMPLNVNILMQMLGRINRTGQRTEPDMLPSFSILGTSIPAEKRPMATALGKLSSLNANTSANTEGSTTFDAVNILNRYGDWVVNEYLSDNPDLANQLEVRNELVDVDGNEESASDGLAKKVTGRLAAYATVEEQERFYSNVEAMYNDMIEYKDSIGDNKLKSLSLDLRATILESEMMVEGKKGDKSTAISGDAVAHKVKARQTQKPPDAKTVNKALKKSIGNGTPETYALKQINAVMTAKQAAKQIEKLDQALVEVNVATSTNLSHETIKDAMDSLGESMPPKVEVKYNAYKEILKSRDYRVAVSRGTIETITSNWPVGKPIYLRLDKDQAEAEVGMITGYTIKDNDKGNPLTKSQVKVELMLNSPSAKLRMPLTKMQQHVTAASSDLEVSDIFGDTAKGIAYETRVIITGNLVAALSKVGRGQITTFTDKSKKTHTGLLMPRHFSGNFDQYSATEFVATEPKAMLEMIRKGETFESVDGDVKIVPTGGAFVMEVQLAKSGSPLAKRIREQWSEGTGDFYTVPSQPYYSHQVQTPEAAKRIIQSLNSKAEFVLPETKRDAYVAAGGPKKAKAGDFANTRKLKPRKAPEEKPQFLQVGNTDKQHTGKVRRWTRKLAPNVKVWADMESTPLVIRQAAAQQGITAFRAVHHKGDVHIVASTNPTRQMVEEALLHENQHLGIRKRFGSQVANQLRKLNSIISDAGGIVVVAEQYGVANQIRGYQQGFANLPPEMAQLKLVDELLAFIAQKRGGLAGKIRAAFERVMFSVRKVLRQMGFNLTAKKVHDELMNTIYQSDLGVKEGQQRVIEGQPVFMNAWHGSSHTFDSFSTDAVNSGEGTQQQGWGLYFASQEAVANSYRQQLAGLQYGDYEINHENHADKYSGLDDGYIATDKQAMEHVIDELWVNSSEGFIGESDALDQSKVDEVFEHIKRGYSDPDDPQDRLVLNAIAKFDIDKLKLAGSKYQVSLHPREDEYLLWDASITEQSAFVTEILESNGVPVSNKVVGVDGRYEVQDHLGELIEEFDTRAQAQNYIDTVSDAGNFTGKDIYDHVVSERGSPEAASQWLHSIGIAGNKYLDGSSRKQGGGTYNYVLFDDSNVTIDAQFMATRPLNVKPPREPGATDPKSGKGRATQYIQDYAFTEKTAVQNTKDGLVKAARKFKGGVKRQALGLMTRRQLVMTGSEILPRMLRYLRAAEQLDADRHEWQSEAYTIAEKWGKLPSIVRHELAKVMQRATVEGVDPAKTYTPLITKADYESERKKLSKESKIMLAARDPSGSGTAMAKVEALDRLWAQEQNRKKAHPELVEAWRALPSTAKRVYLDARDHHVSLSNVMLQALEERVINAVGTGKSKKRIWAKIQAEFESNRVQEPYFPLSRFGEFWVASGEGQNRSVDMFETIEEQKQFVEEVQNSGVKVQFGKNVESLAQLMQVPTEFVTSVDKLLDDGKSAEKSPKNRQLRDQIYQLYLQSLPEMSARRHFIHRKNTAGFSHDALRAFSKSAFHMAGTVARLRHGHELEDNLTELKRDVEQAGRVNISLDRKSLLEDYRDNVMNAGLKFKDLEAMVYSPKTPKDEIPRIRAMMTLYDSHETMDKVNKELGVLNERIETAALVNKSAETRAAASDYASELQLSHERMNRPNTSPVATALNSLGFGWFLGTTPAAALINTAQVPMVTLPILGSKHGFKRTSAVLNDMYREFFRPEANGKRSFSLSDKLNGEEMEAFNELVRRGTLSLTQAHDLVGLAEEGQHYSSTTFKIKKVMSFGFHHAERLNREVTSMAAYRLARENGMEHQEAVQEAIDITQHTQFDYTASNRARFFAGNAARVMLQFKQYSAGITYLYVDTMRKAFKNESPAVRKEGRRALAGLLGIQFGVTGALGMPLARAAGEIVEKLVNAFDEEDDFDYERELRQGLADLFGSRTSNMLTKGVFDSFIPVGLHGRLSISELWVRSPDRELEGRSAHLHYLQQAAGPVLGGLLGDALFIGPDLIMQGQVQRGVERMVPKFMRDISKYVRYQTDGALTMGGSELTDLNQVEMHLQLIGFTPASLSNQYDENNAKNRLQKAIVTRRRGLLRELVDARQEGDRSTLRELESERQEFNRKFGFYPILPKNIKQSEKSRRRAKDETIKGVRPNRKMQGTLSQINFGS